MYHKFQWTDDDTCHLIIRFFSQNLPKFRVENSEVRLHFVLLFFFSYTFHVIFSITVNDKN